MKETGTKDIDIRLLLKPKNTVHSQHIDNNYFQSEEVDLFRLWSNYLCPNENSEFRASDHEELDSCFNTIIDRPLDELLLLKNVLESKSLKPYILDSLKRYHALYDILDVFSACSLVDDFNKLKTLQKKIIEQFLTIAETVTSRILLVSTIESMSEESQRYLGNFIQRNDLPLPLSYYTFDSTKQTIQYKINFNLLLETMCLTHNRFVLQLGSSSATGCGKTSLLQYLFNIRVKSLNTNGNLSFRTGCIDTLFAKMNYNENSPVQSERSSNISTRMSSENSYFIFDVHGTMNCAVNEEIITVIQQYSSFQILYVTEDDLNDHQFLPLVMNYSKTTQAKPTIIVIFDKKFDDKSTSSDTIIKRFKQLYAAEKWKHVFWLTVPIFHAAIASVAINKENILSRWSKRIRKSLSDIMLTLQPIIHQQPVCRSIFAVQNYFLRIKLKLFEYPSVVTFPIETKSKTLFDHLDDNTQNLLLTTPVSYLQSTIKTCQRKLDEKFDESIKRKKDWCDQKLRDIHSISEYSQFFIDLLTHYTYIELLMTERYLEQWRSKYVTGLNDEITETKNHATQYQDEIKNIEKKNSVYQNPAVNQAEAENCTNQLRLLQKGFKDCTRKLQQLEEKLTNVDLTIGLYCDEILALYDYPPALLSQSTNLIHNLTKAMVHLMYKGYAFHILRGRPLHCKNELLNLCMKYLQRQNRSPYVITVIGEQSSAKSSLLNSTFGCNFRVSAGRCTIGIYLSVVQWKSETIIILDTEGLLSLEEADSIFDNQMVSMAMLSSHMVLINQRGDVLANLQALIGISFYAKLQIGSADIKPKLMFVLRDQKDFENKQIFYSQLAKLKENLYRSAKFLKSSIDEELDIKANHVLLMPDAFANDVTYGITLSWRNQLFPEKIFSLRNIIAESLFTTKTSKPPYANMEHFYSSISSNWDAIDNLGQNLLDCKSLHDISIKKELQDIASEIIDKKNDELINDSEEQITEILANVTNDSAVTTLFETYNKHFTNELNDNCNHKVQEAIVDFKNRTELSCYSPDIKEKIEKIIEPTIMFTRDFVQRGFEDKLHEVAKKQLIPVAQDKLIREAQKAFDENHENISQLLNKLEIAYKNIKTDCQNHLKSFEEPPENITKKIIKYYTTIVKSESNRHSHLKSSIYTRLSPLSVDKYNTGCSKFNSHWTEINNSFVRPSTSDIRNRRTATQKVTGFFTKSNNQDELWLQLINTVSWFKKFKDKDKDQKNLRRILSSIWNEILPELQHKVCLLIKDDNYSSFDQQNVRALLNYIENANDSKVLRDHAEYINFHSLLDDFAIISLKLLIEEAIKAEKRKNAEQLKQTLTEIESWKKNLTHQYECIKSSNDQGKHLAGIVGCAHFSLK